jgi:uncharacterized UBP type Zn finger protein
MSKSSTFEECIRHYCMNETLDGSNKYKCGGCNKLSKANKRMTIYKPPRILVLHFLRFTHTGRKIVKHVKFPKCFNLRAFVSENVDSKLPKDDQSSHIYHLYGVIVHAGNSSNSGHYYSFVKKEDKWYLCNDERITEVRDIDQVLKQNAYILIYRYKMNAAKKVVPKKKENLSEVSDILNSLNLKRTKSLTAEILETQQNKNLNNAPLSGYWDSKVEVNSDEEEEKLITKVPVTKKEQEKFTELDYILDNFEDIDFNDIKNLDFLRNLSVVSPNDDISTPELKSYISKRVMQQKGKLQNMLDKSSNGDTGSTSLDDGIKVPRPISKKSMKSGDDKLNLPPLSNLKILSKKRDKKEASKKLDNSQIASTDSTPQKSKKNRKRNRNKNKNKNQLLNSASPGSEKTASSTNNKFDSLVKRLLHVKN